MGQSFGIIYSELLDQFQIGKGETSWIPSLNTGLLMGLGPLAGMLEHKLGCGTIALVGSVIIAIGMLCSGFVNSLYLLYITYGIISGFGAGLASLAAHVVPLYHFDKRLSLAAAFTSAGGGVGTITIPLLTRFLLKEYGWKGTFTLMAGVALQGTISGALFILLKASKRCHDSVSQTPTDLKDGIKVIFTNKQFGFLAVSCFTATLGYFSIFVILPHVAEIKGLTKDEAAILITCAGISGLIGGIVIGIIADLPKVNRCLLNSIFLISGGLATFGYSYIYSFRLFLAYSVFLGIFLGAYAFLQGVITVDIIGRDLLSIAFGFLACFQGISNLIGSPIAGWIVDATGRYDEAFYFLGSVYILGGLMCLMITLCNKNDKKMNRELDPNISINTSSEMTQM